MELITEPYAVRLEQLPDSGRHIIAHYDDDTVVVYQAYRREIGAYAVAENQFAGAPGFKIDRMTWIKPSFLWLMHRAGWATKPEQTMILAIWLDRVGFDAILKKAVLSAFDPAVYADEAQWQRAKSGSSVRVQWDPDYTPDDQCLARRAIQIGLGGKAAHYYATGGWIVHIEDVSPLVMAQKTHVTVPFTNLTLPRERPYPMHDPDVVKRLRM